MKILFINHSAARTGAPIVLLHFLKWLKYEKTVSFDVLSLQNGDLLEEFTEISDRHYFKKKKENLLDKVVRSIRNNQQKTTSRKLLYPERDLMTIAKNNYDLIYANSIVSIPAGHFIKSLSVGIPKLLVHFHELNLTIHQHCPEVDLYESGIDLTVAASKKVKDNLIDNWGFNDFNIKVVYAHSKVRDFIDQTTDEFIVGASGIVDWRKGPDFFLLVAQYVIRKLPEAPIKFQWVGRISKLNRLIFEGDIKRLGLFGKVEFTGAKDNPHDYFSNFDVFLMTSKEDPFPLVCVEVGMMGKPIVCFEGATGTEEVLKTVEGAIAPYLDIAKMGETVIRYYKDLDFRLENGRKTKQIFQEFTPEKQGAKLLNIMNDLLKEYK